MNCAMAGSREGNSVPAIAQWYKTVCNYVCNYDRYPFILLLNYTAVNYVVSAGKASRFIPFLFRMPLCLRRSQQI